LFIDKLQFLIDQLKSEKPRARTLTGAYKCRSSQWWPGDTEQPEGNDLDEFIETNNMYQLINESTNIRGDSISYIDQPVYVVETGVKPSLDNHCQHQLIFGKLSIASPFPPPYRKVALEYSKTNIANIRCSSVDTIGKTVFKAWGVTKWLKSFMVYLSQFFMNAYLIK